VQAFGASEALSDRFCIASNGSTNVVLSPQDLVSCDTTDAGCNGLWSHFSSFLQILVLTRELGLGGQLDHAWNWIEKNGIASDACIPYTSADGSVAACPCTHSLLRLVTVVSCSFFFFFCTLVSFFGHLYDVHQGSITREDFIGPFHFGFYLFVSFI
jgi:cathepsin B